MSSKASHDIGWIGLGRMGEAMAARLVKAGHGLSVWNRTASKADPLAQIGAEVVTDKTAMAHCASVFTMVSTTDDLKDILFGAGGVLTGNARPKRVVDMSSISDTGSAEIRKGLTNAGVAYLSAPVSGNGAWRSPRPNSFSTTSTPGRAVREEAGRLIEDVPVQRIAQVHHDALTHVGHQIRRDVRSDALEEVHGDNRPGDDADLLLFREHAVENRLDEIRQAGRSDGIDNHAEEGPGHTPAIRR